MEENDNWSKGVRLHIGINGKPWKAFGKMDRKKSKKTDGATVCVAGRGGGWGSGMVSCILMTVSQ